MRRVTSALVFGVLCIANFAAAAEPFFWHQGSLYGSIAWSPDGQKLAVADVMGGKVQILSSIPVQQLKTYEIAGSMITSVNFFPDGEHLMIAWLNMQGAKGGTQVRNLRSDEIVWESLTPITFNAAASPDGESIAASTGEEVVLHGVTQQKALKTYKAHDRFNADVLAFTRDGRGLAAGSDDHSIVAWAVDSQKLVTTLKGHTDKVKAVEFANRNGALASGGADGQVILWNVAKGQPHWKNRHDGRVNAVAISPDAKLIASAGEDRVIRTWDFLTGKPDKTFNSHNRRVFGLAWHPGGHQIAVAYDGGVVIYSRESEPLIAIPEPVPSKFRSTLARVGAVAIPKPRVDSLLSAESPSNR